MAGESQWTAGEIVDKHFWTPRLVSLRFDANIAPFRAGQFLRLGLDIDGERVGRPYSLINAPDEHPLEVYFNVVGDGQLSPQLAALERGERVWVHRNANGFLVLDEVPAVPDLWLMSTGTGIGPFISMLKTAAIWQRFENVVLVHAVRRAEDLNYSELIIRLRGEYAGRFHFAAFVSRERMPQTFHGRIPDAIANRQLETGVGLILDPQRSHVMLCGNSAMIEDTSRVLAERGMKRHRRREPGQISAEKYF